MEVLVKKDKLKIKYLKAFTFFSPFLFGGYHIWTSALFSAVLLIYLIMFYRTEKDEKKQVRSLSFLSVLLIPLSYLVVSLWAIDGGTAVYGFVKFFPVALFAVAVLPLSKEEKSELTDTVPYSAIAMGIIAYSLSFIPSLSDYFLVASRLGGFFQYPNSFACYCLAGIPVLLLKEKLTYKNWIGAVLLLGIILLTGSRTVFLLLIAVSVFLVFKIKAEYRMKLALTVGGIIAVSFIVALVTDNLQTVGRYLTISLESSTLLGRLLYYKDALPVILKHPFGMGYYGYYFSQGSFQSGVYSVAYIHNDFLQMLLDIGWIPALMFAFTVVKSFLSKNTDASEKLVLFIICSHSLLDFDLQFVSVFLLLILVLDFNTGYAVSYNLNRRTVVAVLSVGVIISVYFGAVNGLYLLKKYDAAEKLYGRDTMTLVSLMTEEKDYEKINAYAERILSENKYVSVAYSAKANYALKKGDISSFTYLKEKAIDCARYSIDEYNDYCGKLLAALNLYLEAGDIKSAEYCLEKVLGIEKKLAGVKENTDALAWKIKDKPELELRKEYTEYIREYRK